MEPDAAVEPQLAGGAPGVGRGRDTQLVVGAAGGDAPPRGARQHALHDQVGFVDLLDGRGVLGVIFEELALVRRRVEDVGQDDAPVDPAVVLPGLEVVGRRLGQQGSQPERKLAAADQPVAGEPEDQQDRNREFEPCGYPSRTQPSRYSRRMNLSASGQPVAFSVLESHSSFFPTR